MTLLLIAYSVLLVIGGLIGYFAAGSLASLIMSSGFALLIIGSLFIKHYIPAIGYAITYILLAILSAFFLFRAFHTGKFMPPGLLALISIGVLITLLIQRNR